MTVQKQSGASTPGAHGAISFREFLGWLEERGELVRVAEPVSHEYGITELAHGYDGDKAVLVERMEGFGTPLAFGIFNRRSFIAAALGTSDSSLLEEIIARSRRPLSPVVLEGRAPCQEIVVEQPRLLEELPFPRHYERDAGRYCTSGVIVAREPGGSAVNVSFARMQICEDHIRVMVNQWRHLLAMFTQAESTGQDLPVAVVIGPEPALWLEGAMPDGLAPLDADEIAIAGALGGAPIPVVRALTSDLLVPASAEIVIEGRMVAGRREIEGPFGDYPKVYDARPRPNPVIVPTVLTRRSDAIYHDIVPAMYEHFWLGGVPREADLLSSLRKRVHGVRQVHLTPGGVCRFHLVVQIDKLNDAHPREVILAALSCGESSRDVKLVTVVDGDIDPFSAEDVEWAVATRVQWDSDLMTFPRLPVALDPSAVATTPQEALQRGELRGAKAGVDATRPHSAGDLLPMFDKVAVPGGWKPGSE
jgi:2,5-furandicarboxylate decarboxylase 1